MERRSFLALGAAGAAIAVGRPARADGSMWPTIQAMVFNDRPIGAGGDILTLEAPARAHDAATVPMTLAALDPLVDEALGRAGPAGIKTMWLIIDKNPAPLASVFHFGPSTLPRVETRVRVNEYTPVHAIAETADGQLHAVERFVKAAGGCSAPGLKDPAEAQARLGKMKLRPLTAFLPGTPFKLQLLISHPNYTGLQIDQLSRHWIPPDYIQKIRVSFAGEDLLLVDSDISLSEDPSLTFAFLPRSEGELTVAVDDSEGRHFEESWPLARSS